MRSEKGILLIACGAFFTVLLLLGCGGRADFASGPSFALFLQEYLTRVDDGNDSVDDATDSGTVSGGVLDPGALSTSTANHDVTLSAISGRDSVLVECRHSLVPGTSQTECVGTIRAVWRDVRKQEDAVFLSELSAIFYLATTRTPGALPVGLNTDLTGVIAIDCGLFDLSVPIPFAPGRNSSIEQLFVDLGDDCLVEITLTATVTTTSLAQSVEVIQTVSVTTKSSGIPQCTNDSHCDGDTLHCDPTGICGDGDEGQPGVVASAHCATAFVTENGCSHGVSGSSCRGQFECAGGYVCAAGVCVGQTPCTSSLDCPPEAAICTEQGTCSPHGEQGDGCVTGDFCEQGLICLLSRCTAILGQGEDCTVPNTLCGAPLACFPTTGICEDTLPLGASCSAHIECTDFPSLNSCNAAIGSGVCASRSASGGVFGEDIDCDDSSFDCDTGSEICN